MAEGQTVDNRTLGQDVVKLLARQKAFGTLRQTLLHKGRASAEGLWGSSAPALASAMLADCPSFLLFVTAHVDGADDVRDDLELLTLNRPLVFSAWESLSGKDTIAAVPAETDISDEILAARLGVLKSLLPAGRKAEKGGSPRMIVAPIQALMQPVPSPRHLEENTLQLTVGQEYPPADLRRWLAQRGFKTAELVAEPGQYASRGGIIDVYPPAASSPYRLEFFGDQIDSIRTFDIATQRSVDERNEIAITACGPLGLDAADGAADKRQSPAGPPASMCLLDYLPADTFVVLHEPLEIAEMGRSFLTRLASPVGVFAFETIVRRLQEFTALEISSFASPEATKAVRFVVETLPPFSGKAEAVKNEVASLVSKSRVIIFCDNDAERDRLWQILREIPEADRRIRLGIGFLQQGFLLPEQEVAVVANHELFHRYRERRRFKPRVETRPIESFLELARGDYVVHAVHGIGRYLGLKVLDADGKKEETLVLQYRHNVKIYVPASRVDLVQKYIGGFKGRPRLARIGGKAWAEQKKRVALAVEDLAAELLQIQAMRQSRPGISYPPDTLWQREFEASFIYAETPDQLAVMEEIKKDMQTSRPMDRLLCGDVGYGKTELAIRAAFKAAEAGRQVAVLVPTTVLAEQHWRTFTERMADYPILIECLSRFRSRKQQQEILDRVRKGQTDILIGTHRIIQRDVRFADLGLVIIDEEQRFGVEHKERLKRLRRTVDVITMTATPIPRTLHMSLLGIRDISSLSTPPQDRRSIHTEVCPYEPERIRQGILQELSRDGQIFFVHNRVQSIADTADEVSRIAPEARVTYAHGQMAEKELQERMLAFFDRKVDVLVTTTIIESGLDIPTANTMFVNMADRFGLAELHQLRGRIGRYKHRAHCYLLLPVGRPITPSATRRLQAIQRYSELGAGFHIAMRDLEIRGAGNILGRQQSGHIAVVGYEMYCQLLASAIRRAQGLPDEEKRPVEIEINVPAHIPKSYVPGESQRIAIYRQLGRAGSTDVLGEIRNDLLDIYGPMPVEVDMLFGTTASRIVAQKWGISAVRLSASDFIFTMDDLGMLGKLFGPDTPGKVRVVDHQTVYLRMPRDKAQPQEALATLKKILEGGVGQR